MNNLKKKIDIPRDIYLEEQNSLEFWSIVLILAKRINVIISTTIIIVLLSIYYAVYIAKPIFNSSAKIMSTSSNPNSTPVNEIAQRIGLDLNNSTSESSWSYIDIVKSRTLARKLLQTKFDTEKLGPQKLLLQILTSADVSSTVDIEKLYKRGIKKLDKMISIKLNSNFYDLKITASEADLSKQLAEAVIDELDTYQRDYNRSKTSQTRIFIEERIEETRLELEKAEEDLKNFVDRNRRIENSPSLQLQQQRLAREVSVLTGVFTTLKQQNENAKIAEIKESNYVLVLDPPEAPLTRTSPNRKNIVLLGTFLGILFGVTVVFFLEFINSNSNKDLEKIKMAKTLFTSNIRSFFCSF